MQVEKGMPFKKMCVLHCLMLYLKSVNFFLAFKHASSIFTFLLPLCPTNGIKGYYFAHVKD